jgi:PAS domain S-box-containing protein
MLYAATNSCVAAYSDATTRYNDDGDLKARVFAGSVDGGRRFMTGRGSSFREKSTWRLFMGCLRTLISLAVLSVLPLSATSQPKTVLAIYSEQRLLPSMRQLDTALRDGLAVETNPSVTYLSEYLDFGRFGGPAYDKLVSDFLRNKYSGQSIDAIIAVGPLALPFLYRHREDLFHGIPVVFLGVTRESVQAQTLPPNFVGVPVSVEPLQTIRLALSLQPDASEIVIVTGTSDYDRAGEVAWRRDLPQLQTSVPIRYLTGLALNDVLRQLSHLPANTIVYFSSFFRDGAGRTYIPARALRQMADVSTAPIYGSYSTYVGVGVVGGYVFEIEDVGRQAAGLVRRILDGEKITRQDLPATLPSHYLVDWRQLQRWHLAEGGLPPGTVVLYREVGPWQLYRRYIIGGIALILVETLLILGLLWQRVKKREVEKNLAISNDRFRLAVESGKSVGWEWDLKTGQDSWFGDLSTMFGIPSDMFVGRTEDFYRYVHQEDRQSVAKAVAEAKQSRKSYATEFRVVRADGVVRWVSGIGRFYYGSKGDPERMLGIATDITERKRAEEALRESETLERTRADELQTILDAVPVPVRIAQDATCQRMIGNRAAYEQARVATGANVSKSAPPNEQPRYRVMEDGAEVTGDELPMQQAAATGKPVYGRKLTIVYEDGTERETVENAVPLLDDSGKPRGAVGATIDVTEQKRAEKALRESELRFRMVYEKSPVGIALVDSQTGQILQVNPKYCEITGRRQDELVGIDVRSITHPDDIGQATQFLQRLAGGDAASYEANKRYLRPDGSFRWVRILGVPMWTEGDRRWQMALVEDVTERKQAEEARRESDSKLRLLLDSTTEAIYGIDLEHRCTFCNPACLRTLGYASVDEVLGKNMHGLVHHTRADGKTFPVEECRIHRVTQTGEGVHAEDEVLWRANGTSFPAEYWSYPQRRGHEVVGAVIAFNDITDRKSVEAALAGVSGRLIEAQERERARIARDLHDDIGQRLALLSNAIEELQLESPDLPALVRTHLGELTKQTSDIANDIHFLSHRLHSSKLEYLGIAAAVRSFCKEFAEQQKVEIDFQTHDVPSSLPADISLCLFRVAQEALLNAAKYSGVRHFNVRLWATGDEIDLTVSDSGAGFDREAARENTGLGLISMEERLKMLKGALSIESRPKRGTTIHAFVPISSRSDSMRPVG